MIGRGKQEAGGSETPRSQRSEHFCPQTLDLILRSGFSTTAITYYEHTIACHYTAYSMCNYTVTIRHCHVRGFNKARVQSTSFARRDNNDVLEFIN